MSPTPVVVFHLAAAIAAVVLGALLIVGRKGTRTHRWIGRSWVAVMALVSIGSFWIQHAGGLSWIHGLSVMTLVLLGLAVWAIRTGRVDLHRRLMTGTLVGLVIAGAFAFSPGRLLGNLVFGGWAA